MLSVTMLSSYLYCQRKLYLEKVLGIYEFPKESLILGSVRHEVYDLINKAEESIVTSIKKKLQFSLLNQRFKHEHSKILRETILKRKKELKQFNLTAADIFKRTWPLILEESKTRALNIFNFIEKHNLYGGELWENLFPKIQSEFRIESEALKLKGVIDQIEIYKEGHIPIELKTGKPPKDGVWPGHRIQIGAYALLLEDMYKLPIKEGFVHYLDAKEKRRIAINPFLKEEVMGLRDKVLSLINSKEIPPLCGNDNKCLACGLKQKCFDNNFLPEKIKKSA